MKGRQVVEVGAWAGLRGGEAGDDVGVAGRGWEVWGVWR